MQFPHNNPSSNTTDQMSGGLPHVNATESNLLDMILSLFPTAREISASTSSENNSSSQPTHPTLPTMQPPSLQFRLNPTMRWPTLGTNLPTTLSILPPHILRSLQLEFTGNPNLSLFNTTPSDSLHSPTVSNHLSSNSSTMNLQSISRCLPRPICRRRYHCNQCGEMFLLYRELSQHTLQIHDHFRCSLCNATFSQMANLQRHSLKHWHHVPYRCKICLKGYRRRDHLVNHIKNTHPSVDPRCYIITYTRASECFRRLEFPHLYEIQRRFQDGNNSTRSL